MEDLQQITFDFKGYTITTDKALMKVHDIHRWLSEESYWAMNIPFELFKTTFDNSFCIGALADGRQISFARLLTDYAVFGYLADVYVEEAHRKKGISKKMMEVLLGLDWVKGLRNISLATKDAQGLYSQFGFAPVKFPERKMELTRQNIYP